MRFLKNYLISGIVPILVIGFLSFRLAQVTGKSPLDGLFSLPFDALSRGSLIDAAKGGDITARMELVIAVAWGLLAISLASFALSRLVAAAVGKNRVGMATVFPAFSFLTLLLATAFVIADVGLVVGVVWSLGQVISLSFNSVSIWTGIVGIVGLLTVIGFVGAILRMFHVPPIRMLAVQANTTDHRKVLAFVDDVAKSVGASPPKQVVMGLDIQFFATNAPFRPLREATLKGETLYLSLPCLRLLSEGELRAVIGHELGHFSGNDTRYTMAFQPALRGLVEAIGAARTPIFHWKSEKLTFFIPNLLGILASERLEYLALLFHNNASAVSRDREYAADQKGAQASNADDLAAALVRMYVLAQVWAMQGNWNIQRLQKGRVMRNLSRSFAERMEHDVPPQLAAEWVKESLMLEIAHPTDQHPRTSDRIRELNVPVNTVVDPQAVRRRLVPTVPANSLLDDLSFAEEKLTFEIQQFWIAMGARPPDDRFVNANKINILFAQIFAHMVLADHNKDPREIDAAEAHASNLLKDFDADGFREWCRDEQSLAPLDPLLTIASGILDDDQKTELLGLLLAIARADGVVVTEENAVLLKAKEILEV